MQCLESFSLGNVTPIDACRFPARGVEGIQMMFDLKILSSQFLQGLDSADAIQGKGVRLMCCFTDTECFSLLSVDTLVLLLYAEFSQLDSTGTRAGFKCSPEELCF